MILVPDRLVERRLLGLRLMFTPNSRVFVSGKALAAGVCRRPAASALPLTEPFAQTSTLAPITATPSACMRMKVGIRYSMSRPRLRLAVKPIFRTLEKQHRGQACAIYPELLNLSLIHNFSGDARPMA